MLHGHGHQHFLGGATTEKFLHSHLHELPDHELSSHHAVAALQLHRTNFSVPAEEFCPADMVVLWPEQEILLSPCIKGSARYEVWRSHWTPLHTAVHARAVLVSPTVETTCSGSRIAAGGLRGRVAIVARGEIPFTEKATQAQVRAFIYIVQQHGCRYPSSLRVLV